MTREYVLDGAQTTSLESFFREFSGVALSGARWDQNLDAFNDVIKGGFGTPEEGFTFRWHNSELARAPLAYPETVKQMELRLERCHPSNRDAVRCELSDARRRVGPTVFDWLVEIISIHGPGGEEAEDCVILVLA